jgi:hypothetical protein
MKKLWLHFYFVFYEDFEPKFSISDLQQTGETISSSSNRPFFEHIPYDPQTGEGGRNFTTVEGGKAVLTCIVRNLGRNRTVSTQYKCVSGEIKYWLTIVRNTCCTSPEQQMNELINYGLICQVRAASSYLTPQYSCPPLIERTPPSPMHSFLWTSRQLCSSWPVFLLLFVSFFPQFVRLRVARRTHVVAGGEKELN